MNNEVEFFLQKAIANDGFAVVLKVLSEETIESLIEAIASSQKSIFVKCRGNSIYAIRNLLEVPEVRALASKPPIIDLANAVLGTALAVKALLFDKTTQANWKVAWHQDLTIAVKEKKAVEGFSAWSEKAGIPHVQPPVEILENLLTLRIHLDDCNADNGALKVIPKSHLYGKIDSEQISHLKQAAKVHTCTASSGDVLVMRPLLLHSSSASVQPRHRRVLHIEYAALKLPSGLEWFNSEDVVGTVRKFE